MSSPDQPAENSPGPLVLLADSQLLFDSKSGGFLHQQITGYVQQSFQSPFAVYLGASNGCEPAFYELACSAMKERGIEGTLFLKQSLKELDDCRHQTPAVILLAGGDPLAGWNVIGQSPVRDWLLECWRQGTLMLGISAGALHLTSAVGEKEGRTGQQVFLNCYPVVTLVHEEQENWPGYKAYLQMQPESTTGCLKIPFGSGVWIQGERIETFGRQKATLFDGERAVPLTYIG